MSNFNLKQINCSALVVTFCLYVRYNLKCIIFAKVSYTLPKVCVLVFFYSLMPNYEYGFIPACF